MKRLKLSDSPLKVAAGTALGIGALWAWSRFFYPQPPPPGYHLGQQGVPGSPAAGGGPYIGPAPFIPVSPAGNTPATNQQGAPNPPWWSGVIPDTKGWQWPKL